MQNYNKVVKNKFETYYYLDNEYHRLDGPARIWSDGYKEWYYQGKLIKCNSQEEFERYLKLKLFW
jgi:hypothetical protein